MLIKIRVQIYEMSEDSVSDNDIHSSYNITIKVNNKKKGKHYKDIKENKGRLHDVIFLHVSNSSFN